MYSADVFKTHNYSGIVCPKLPYFSHFLTCGTDLCNFRRISSLASVGEGFGSDRFLSFHISMSKAEIVLSEMHCATRAALTSFEIPTWIPENWLEWDRFRHPLTAVPARKTKNVAAQKKYRRFRIRNSGIADTRNIIATAISRLRLNLYLLSRSGATSFFSSVARMLVNVARMP